MTRFPIGAIVGGGIGAFLGNPATGYIGARLGAHATGEDSAGGTLTPFGGPGGTFGGGGIGDDPFGLLASLMGGQPQQGGLYGGASGRSPSYLGGYGLI